MSFWSAPGLTFLAPISLGNRYREGRVPLVVLDQLPLQISIQILENSLGQFRRIRPEASRAGFRRALVTSFLAGRLASGEFVMAAREVPPALVLLLLDDSSSSSYSRSSSSSNGSTSSDDEDCLYDQHEFDCLFGPPQKRPKSETYLDTVHEYSDEEAIKWATPMHIAYRHASFTSRLTSLKVNKKTDFTSQFDHATAAAMHRENFSISARATTPLEICASGARDVTRPLMHSRLPPVN
ncbi:hypothetical protein ISCGN_020017 [Ixodes scapularis]